MAVYAAHLTRTLQGTPSLFQVTAQEALGSTVKPALQKVVEVTYFLCLIKLKKSSIARYLQHHNFMYK